MSSGPPTAIICASGAWQLAERELLDQQKGTTNYQRQSRFYYLPADLPVQRDCGIYVVAKRGCLFEAQGIRAGVRRVTR